MCLPLAVALPLAAMAAGSVMQYAGQQKAENAKLKTFQAERKRQQGFQAEQNERFEDSLESTRRASTPEEQAAAADARNAEYASAVKSAADPAAQGYMPGSSSAPTIVADATAKAGAKSDAQTSQLARSLANLGGLTDVLQRNDINIGRNAQAIGQLGGFARGSMGVLQSEMDAAAQKGATLRMLGGLAKQIGGAFLGAGAGAGAGGMAAGSGAAIGAGASGMNAGRLALSLAGAI